MRLCQTSTSRVSGMRTGTGYIFRWAKVLSVLATRFGSLAVELLQRRRFGMMTALHSPDIVAVPLDLVVGQTRNVPVDGDVVRTARNVGICFGD